MAQSNTLAKSKVIQLVPVCSNGHRKVPKALSLAELTKHQYQKLIPAGKRLYIAVTIVFCNKSIELASVQKGSNLRENVFDAIHVSIK